MAELNINNQPADILAQMHDIHLPAEAANWPPAPGWIILLVITIIFCVGIIIFIKRNYGTWQTKKHALAILKSYQKQYPQQINSQRACALINELLKKTAFFYYPRPLVASLKGLDWLNFLNQTMYKPSYLNKIQTKFMRRSIQKQIDFISVSKELLEYPYQNSKDIELDELFFLTRAWIKGQKSFTKNREAKLCLK